MLLAAVAICDESQKGLAAFEFADYETALAIWQPLAEAGDANSQYGLGQMYGNGWGVEQSDEEAMRLYALAAEKGNSVAMVALGQFVSMDFLDSYDPVQAYKWFGIAAMLDGYDAVGKRDDIVKKLTAEQRAEGDALIAAWSERYAALVASD